jgi:hypothetical protein
MRSEGLIYELGLEGLIYELGLASAADESEQHPIHPYTCRGCGRPVRCMEWDGYCESCAGEQLDEAALMARTREAARRGHQNAARLLHRMGYHDRARIHEQEADRG